ncbi:hypothetical protein CS542_09975 [Pedobacter sp. IW39]|nr:hypothetical protein CS542_09975 [Pedobacter sp. IW39]
MKSCMINWQLILCRFDQADETKHFILFSCLTVISVFLPNFRGRCRYQPESATLRSAKIWF